MNNINNLLESEENWETSLGYIIPGIGGVFHGKPIAAELKELSWTALVWFGVTGEVPDEKIIKIWDRVWAVCTNYPDPRIWNNRVASLCGTTKSTASLAVASSTAVSEAQIYGRGIDIRAMHFLNESLEKLDNGIDVNDIVRNQLKKHKLMPGFGRPVNPDDERVKPILNYAEELNMHNGKFVRLAIDIEKVVRSTRYKFYLNIGGLAAALASDMGLTPRQYIHFLTTCFSVGALVCYRDSSSKKEGVLFPLRCDRISYEGVNIREW